MRAAQSPGRFGSGAVAYRFRAELGERWRSWILLVLVVAVAAGTVLALLAGARRTDTAYDRFVDDARGYDALVSLSVSGFGDPEAAELDPDEVRALPQVADTARTGSFFVTLGAGVGVLVPANERIGTEINAFKMLEGRRPDPGDPTEVAIGFELAAQEHLAVGDTIRVIDPIFLEPPPPEFGLSPEEIAEFEAARERVLATLPDNALTVVGIEASPGEFPPQIEGTGRYLVHASPALYPIRDDLAMFSDGSDQLMVRFVHGAADTSAFVRGLERLGASEGIQLTLQREATETVNRSLQTQAVALYLLAALTALAGALIAGQLLARLTMLESADLPVLAALGMSRRQRLELGLLRAATIGTASAVLAIVLAVALSPLFPTGLAGIAEPDPGLHVDSLVLALGVLGILVLVVGLASWPAWRSARHVAGAEIAPTRPSAIARFLAGRSAPLPVSTGVRMALEPGAGAATVPVRSSLVGITLGLGTLIAAITFGASLAHLLDTPALYGKTWDLEFTTYDELIAEDGVEVLAADDRVDGFILGIFRSSFAVDGRRVDGLVLDRSHGDLAPSVIEGRIPRGPREIALGGRTLRTLDAEVGDTVPVAPFATDREPVPMTVVGRAVFPLFGEVGQLGDGTIVSSAGWERILGEPLDVSDTGVLVRLAPGADGQAVADDLGEALNDSIFVIGQGRPTDILNFGRVEATPYILGAILAAISVATFAHLLVSAVRRRRRELAVLKTLGFERRQVRATVGWQATTLVVVSLVVGLPLGVAIGRWVWTAFADNLGVVVDPQVPVLALVLTAVAALVVSQVVAAVPARLAARTRAGVVLRSE